MSIESSGPAVRLASAARVGRDIAFIAIDSAGEWRPRVTGRNEAQRLRYASIVLRDGAQRQIVLAVRGETLDRDGFAIPDLHGAALATEDLPDFTVAPLLAGLDTQGRLRLARFLLETLPVALRVSRHAEYAAVCRDFVNAINRKPEPVTVAASLTDDFLLCFTALSPAFGDQARAVLVTGDGIAPVAQPVRMLPSRGRAALVLPPAILAVDAHVVVMSPTGLACRRGTTRRGAAGSVVEQVLGGKHHPAETAAIIDSSLIDLSREQPRAGALLREYRLVRDAGRRDNAPLKGKVDLAIRTPGLVAVSGTLDDPHGLIETIEVVEGSRTTTVPTERFVRWRQPGGEAFCASVALDGVDGAPFEIKARTASGATLPLGEGPSALPANQAIERLLAAIPDSPSVSPRLTVLLQPVFAALLAADRASDVTWLSFGPPATPETSVVCLLADDPEVARYRMLSLAAQTAGPVEIVHVLTDPERLQAWERVLHDLAQLTGIATRLLVARSVTPPARLLNLAIAAAKGRHVAVLGHGVAPETPDWIARFARTLDSEDKPAVVGGVLIDARSTPIKRGIDTAAAAPSLDFAMLAHPAFETAGGIGEDYLDTAHRDADFALRLRQHGFTGVVVENVKASIVGPAVERRERLLRDLDRATLHARWSGRLQEQPLPETKEIATPALPLRRRARRAP